MYALADVVVVAAAAAAVVVVVVVASSADFLRLSSSSVRAFVSIVSAGIWGILWMEHVEIFSPAEFIIEEPHAAPHTHLTSLDGDSSRVIFRGWRHHHYDDGGSNAQCRTEIGLLLCVCVCGWMAWHKEKAGS